MLLSMIQSALFPGRARRRSRRSPPHRTRLELELLESRCVLSDLHLTPLVAVSGTSPFFGNPIEANDPREHPTWNMSPTWL